VLAGGTGFKEPGLWISKQLQGRAYGSVCLTSVRVCHRQQLIPYQPWIMVIVRTVKELLVKDFPDLFPKPLLPRTSLWLAP